MRKARKGPQSRQRASGKNRMELAYRNATEDSPVINQIRDNVIVTITPVAEPDGRDRYVDWYYRYKVDEKTEEDSLGGPPYWGKYIFHDNNRDINYSQVTMRTLLDWYLQWHPPIMHATPGVLCGPLRLCVENSFTQRRKGPLKRKARKPLTTTNPPQEISNLPFYYRG